MMGAYACEIRDGMRMILVIWNFGDKILLRGENVKPEKNVIFPRKGKIVNCYEVQVESLKFSRSRMTKQTSPLESSQKI